MASSASVASRVKKDKEKLLIQLRQMPIIEVASKRSGVSRATYYRWRSEDKDFLRESEAALQQGIDLINDMSESQLISLIKDKKHQSIAFWLRNNHSRYGAKEKFARPAKIESLSNEQKAIIEKVLQSTSLEPFGYIPL